MRRIRSKSEFAERLSVFLKGALEEAGLTYSELGDRMTKLGVPETEETIKQKLKRGTFSAIFFVSAAAALGLKILNLDDL